MKLSDTTIYKISTSPIHFIMCILVAFLMVYYYTLNKNIGFLYYSIFGIVLVMLDYFVFKKNNIYKILPVLFYTFYFVLSIVFIVKNQYNKEGFIKLDFLEKIEKTFDVHEDENFENDDDEDYDEDEDEDEDEEDEMDIEGLKNYIIKELIKIKRIDPQYYELSELFKEYKKQHSITSKEKTLDLFLKYIYKILNKEKVSPKGGVNEKIYVEGILDKIDITYEELEEYLKIKEII